MQICTNSSILHYAVVAQYSKHKPTHKNHLKAKQKKSTTNGFKLNNITGMGFTSFQHSFSNQWVTLLKAAAPLTDAL